MDTENVIDTYITYTAMPSMVQGPASHPPHTHTHTHTQWTSIQLLKRGNPRVPFGAQQLTNPIRIHEDASSIPGLTQEVKDPALQCRSQTRLGSHVAVAVV